MPKNIWNDAEAKENPSLDGLVYRSNLLGRDRSVVNIYGGNTSVKCTEMDHMGRLVRVLWVKGSGSDVATITEQGFAGLRLEEILPLVARKSMSDEEMVAYLTDCTFAFNRPRQSIETLMHALNAAPHVDHTHPDAIISLACAVNGRKAVIELWGERAIWIDYLRPGFQLSKEIFEGLRVHSRADVVVMGKHGLVTWGETSRTCYDQTIHVIQEAEEYIEAHRRGRQVFGAITAPPLASAERRAILTQILPGLRGAISNNQPAILQLDESVEIAQFAGSERACEISQVGAACPDHLVNTKRQPLFINWKPEQGVPALAAKLAEGVQEYARGYSVYFQAHRAPSNKMFDPHPRVILIPAIGMINAGADAQSADVSRQLYQRAVAAMRGSESLSPDLARINFASLDAPESYAIEYWPLELYKLSLKPPPKELAGRVVVVTGGASGIGRATAYRLAQDGAHIAILDINHAGAQEVAQDLVEHYGHRRAMAWRCDVTDEANVASAFEEIVLAYGGIDIVVSNAGIAISAPIDETTLADWNRTMDVLAKGYFLVSRAAFRIWKQQNMGGSLVYVASKNSVVAGKNAAIYSAAKAAELHLARCLAEEGGAIGVRVNTVLPDAVLAGSSIWDAGWREARAAGYGIKPEELDEYYRQRTTLKVNVFPENVAEAISYFAGQRASRTTGGVLTVDGGVAAAFVR